MTKKHAVAFVSVLAFVVSESAFAYVGPGAGLSLIGALWGLIVAIVAALGFIILWPMRRMRRQRAMAQRGTDNQPTRKRENPSIDDEGGREAS